MKEQKKRQLLTKYRANLDEMDFERVSTFKGKKPLFENRISLSISEFAFHVGVSTRTVERALKNNELHYKRFGRRIVIPVAAIETWLNRKDKP